MPWSKVRLRVATRLAVAVVSIPLLVASAGTVLGTLVGERVLRRTPESFYRRVVSALLLALAVFMVLRRR